MYHWRLTLLSSKGHLVASKMTSSCHCNTNFSFLLQSGTYDLKGKCFCTDFNCECAIKMLSYDN